MDIIRIGTRGSKLALVQAEYILNLLKPVATDIKLEIVTISTRGDKDRASSLASIGGTGVFTKNIENELLNSNIDIAVHSAKDLPSVMTEGLTIGAVPPREVIEDTLISNDNIDFDDLKQGAIVGTSSPRRKAMLLYARPDLRVEEIRGNVETRLRKLDDGLYDAIIVARAGLARLGLESKISSMLPVEEFLPAPGQGAILAQVREDDTEIRKLLQSVNDSNSHRCLTAERLLLKQLHAGCSAAVGGLARVKGKAMSFQATVLDTQGTKRIKSRGNSDNIDNDDAMVSAITENLYLQGAKELIG